MRTRPFPLLLTLLLATACTESPAGIDVEPQLAHGGGGPPMLATQVAAGALHACALSVDGSAWCWGLNDVGQLGSGNGDDSSVPVSVAGGHRFASITSGGLNHTCGLTRSGEAWCWGQNGFGQLGDGTTTNSPVPVRAAPGRTFGSISAGPYHTCGLTDAGAAWCWGSNGPLNQAGPDGVVPLGWAFGTPTPDLCPNPAGSYRGNEWYCSPTPVAVPGPAFVSIDAGLWSTCGLTAAGQVYCTGWNVLWAFGNGTADNAPTMTLAAGGMIFDRLAQGAISGCGITGGAASCWGSRIFGNGVMGDGSYEGNPTPEPVAGGLSFTSIHPSDANDIRSFMCGVATDGAAYCWGTNLHGGLGTEAALDICPFFGVACSTVPAPVAGDHRFIHIATGREFACGVTQSRQVYCWGWNDGGQLGNGTFDDAFTPTRVASPGNRGKKSNAAAAEGERNLH